MQDLILWRARSGLASASLGQCLRQRGRRLPDGELPDCPGFTAARVGDDDDHRQRAGRQTVTTERERKGECSRPKRGDCRRPELHRKLRSAQRRRAGAYFGEIHQIHLHAAQEQVGGSIPHEDKIERRDEGLLHWTDPCADAPRLDGCRLNENAARNKSPRRRKAQTRRKAQSRS